MYLLRCIQTNDNGNFDSDLIAQVCAVCFYSPKTANVPTAQMLGLASQQRTCGVSVCVTTIFLSSLYIYEVDLLKSRDECWAAVN